MLLSYLVFSERVPLALLRLNILKEKNLLLIVILKRIKFLFFCILKVTLNNHQTLATTCFHSLITFSINQSFEVKLLGDKYFTKREKIKQLFKIQFIKNPQEK